MMTLICWLKGLWRSVPTIINSGFPTSGHNYVEDEVHDNVKVTLSYCEECGARDFAWEKH